MRTCLRIGLALLMALAVSTTVYADSPADRFSVNASVGPSFANMGTTLSTRAGLDFKLSDRVALAGEFGALSHAPFRDASEVAPPIPDLDPDRVNAYHWNGNIVVRPFEVAQVSPYVTAGIGSFIADTITESRSVGGLTVSDVRRSADFATNLGAGVLYRVNDWVGLNADYRTFFVHRDADDPKVHRFSTGISFFLG
ncbi:MAG TPA: porin family protein [Vicinamibacterales bacterium]|nr:porin family protein [Vicinamibacterales bacterium]